MPYIPIRNLSRRGEKVAPFLSLQNITGMAALAGPTWLIAAGAPDMLRVVLVLVTAAAGYLITLDLRGMSLTERMLWRARGQIRRVVRGRTVAPADLPGMAAQVVFRAIPRDGAFRMHQSVPLPAPRTHAALDALAASALRQAQLRAASDPAATDAADVLIAA